MPTATLKSCRKGTQSPQVALGRGGLRGTEAACMLTVSNCIGHAGEMQFRGDAHMPDCRLLTYNIYKAKALSCS